MTPQILLVDDNAVQADTRRAILARLGLRIAVTAQPAEALELLERVEVQASLRLMVTDHLMPGMNGPELVRRLRVLLPHLPVLVLSGMAGAETEYEGLEVSFKLKPFPPDELLALVSQLAIDPMLRSA